MSVVQFYIRVPIVQTKQADPSAPNFFNAIATFKHESRYPEVFGRVTNIVGVKRARDACPEAVFDMLVAREAKDMKTT